MGMKKRSKVSAEFSMASLTDIIFLLLIFFMLTANFVQIKPFDLPESDSKTIAPTNIVVELEKSGSMALNGKKISSGALISGLRNERNQLKPNQKASVTIVAEKGVAFKRVAKVMESAAKLNMKAILATQAKS